MNEPRARAQDDKQSLDDLHQVERAVIEARHALTKAMVGHGPRERESFIFNVGFARGRLSRIAERIYAGMEPPPPINDDGGDAP
jgi:hypothetical protein